MRNIIDWSGGYYRGLCVLFAWGVLNDIYATVRCFCITGNFMIYYNITEPF